MNYYPFHIGDYASHTAHLEPLEDLAYRRAIDAYYLREGPLPTDTAEVARILRLRGHQPAVDAVLAEFFVLTDAGWHNTRCEEEIEAMREKQQRQRDKANKRWHKPEQEHGNATALPQHCHGNAGAMPPTPTPTPTPNTSSVDEVAPRKRSASTVPDKPADVDQQVWDDFLAIRRAKKSPLTSTALAGIAREAEKAGLLLPEALATCCARGWQGFKAEWVQRDALPTSATQQVRETFRERDSRLARERMEEALGRRITDHKTIDITPLPAVLELKS